MHLFFSVGEPSGDQHAAQLMQALRSRRPELRCSGFGGPLMEQAGLDSLFRLTDLAVMGFFQVLPALGKFHRQYRRAQEFLARERPDAVVLVDFPGFNWWIAAAARKLGIPTHYYLPPQLWAWAPWRIRKVRRYVDVILATLPFEAEWYQRQGVDVEYVGHPFFDEVAGRRLDHAFLDRCRWGEHGHLVRTVGILPGSRTQEIEQNFPVMLRVMQRLAPRHPDVRFRVACYKEAHRTWCRERLQGEFARLPVDLHVGRTPEIIEAADCCLMTSGSVSLELLARTTPAVVQYRAGVVTGAIAKTVLTCPYISLPNLIAGRAVMPEHAFALRADRHSLQMALTLDDWLSDRRQLERARAELQQVKEQVVRTGGLAQAAETILRRLGQSPAAAPADPATPVIQRRAA